MLVRETQVRHTPLEILLQALQRRRVAVLETRDQGSAALEGRLVARRPEHLVDQLLHPPLHPLRQLRQDVPHLVHLAALAEGLWPPPPDRLLQPRRAVEEGDPAGVAKGLPPALP